MTVMSEEKVRVDFNAPPSLVEQADSIADVLDISRTQLLIDALRDELEDLATDEQVTRELRQAYYDGRADFDVVESVIGTEAAMRMKVLRESLDREPPEPVLDGEIPAEPDFYDGEVPEWTPNGSSENDSKDPASSR